MKRRALLIACNESAEGLNCSSDLEAFRDFLSGAAGGGWSRDEISLIDGTDVVKIKAAVQSASDADFAWVLVKARGVEAKLSRPWSEVRVELEGSHLDEQAFNPGCGRLVLAFDCVGARGTKQDGPVLAKGSTAKARALYDEVLAASEGGVVKIFAGRQDGAGSLTSALLKVSRDWCKAGTGVLALGEAVKRIQLNKEEHHATPNVECRLGRRLRDFPLCIAI